MADQRSPHDAGFHVAYENVDQRRFWNNAGSEYEVLLPSKIYEAAGNL